MRWDYSLLIYFLLDIVKTCRCPSRYYLIMISSVLAGHKSHRHIEKFHQNVKSQPEFSSEKRETQRPGREIRDFSATKWPLFGRQNTYIWIFVLRYLDKGFQVWKNQIITMTFHTLFFKVLFLSNQNRLDPQNYSVVARGGIDSFLKISALLEISTFFSIPYVTLS